MDPTNPRWHTSEERRARSATLWKIIVGAVGASALTAMVVASAMGGRQARRDVAEPAYVQTTAVAVPVAQPQQAADGTGAVDETSRTTGATVIVPPGTTINNTTNNILPDGTTSTSTTARAVAPPATHVPNTPSAALGATVATNGSTDANDPNNRNAPESSVAGTYAPKPAPAATPTNGGNAAPGNANATNGSAPAQQGSNPDAPSFSAGAGAFGTEAPYWSSSAWKSDPNAGAGAFTTERNTPAR